MRQLGTLSSQQQAELLIDFLMTQQIDGSCEASGEQWDIWIRDEDHLEQAREIFAEFLVDPQAQRFRDASSKASAIRRERQKKRQSAAKNVHRPGASWNTNPQAKDKPVCTLLLGLSVAVFLLTSFGHPDQDSIGNRVLNTLTMLDLDAYITAQAQISAESGLRTWDPTDPVNLNSLAMRTWNLQHGQLWRLWTPCIIHFGILHIVFNMWMLYSIGGRLESQVGWKRFLVFVLIAGGVSNFVQGTMPMGAFENVPVLKDLKLDGSLRFGGMSGVVYGVFGWWLIRQKRGLTQGIHLPPSSVIMMIGWLFAGVVGFIPNIANWGHIIGFVAGLLTGYLPIWLRSIRDK